MQQTNLVYLLARLSTRERSRLGQYIQSPFFNRHEGIIALYDWLLTFAPRFEGKEFTRQAAWQATCPGKPYDELRLNNFLSQTLQLAYGFLAHLEYEKRPEAERQLLLQALLDREAEKLWPRNTKRAEALLQQIHGRSYAYHLADSQLQGLLDQEALQRKQRQHTPHLQAESDALDRYFWCNKLRIACDMASRSGVIKARYDCFFLPEMLGALPLRPALAEDLSIQIYHCALLMLQQGSSEAYHRLFELLQAHVLVLTPPERYTLYHYLLNYSIRRINSGGSSYYQETLKLYQAMLDEDLLLVNGQLSQWSFKNIVTTGIRLKAFEWTSAFLAAYENKLPAEDRSNAMAYNRAALAYARRDFDQALQQLQSVEFTDASYHLGAKIIQLKIYFDRKETEAFFPLVRAFEQYLRRHRELSDYRRQANLNFAYLARRAFTLRLAPGRDERAQEQWEADLASLDPLANKEWLENLGKA